MEYLGNDLEKQLLKCSCILKKDYTQLDLHSLNLFCFDFLVFAEKLQHFFTLFRKEHNLSFSKQRDSICLSLMQITTCIRCMEQCFKLEGGHNCIITLAREHFLDRLHWCFKCLDGDLNNLIKIYGNEEDLKISEENATYDELMDLILDNLEAYTCYEQTTNLDVSTSSTQCDVLQISKDVRNWVNTLIGLALAFGNVALKQDRKGLSVLSQKVLHECIKWQEACEINASKVVPINESEFKLKAMCLENALYNLEDFINECLLRAIYISFMDIEKCSVEKIRTIISTSNADDPLLDEFIADFDVNLDRIHQIGLFAIAFTTNQKLKTIIRNCLASFESLDSSLMPSLMAAEGAQLYANLLESHYNDEVNCFKKAIYDVVHMGEFSECYLEYVDKILRAIDKEFNKSALQVLIQMGKILQEQLQQKVLHETPNCKELFDKFSLILSECHAVLSTQQEIDVKRIVKRFKILRSILQKLIKVLQKDDQRKTNLLIMSEHEKPEETLCSTLGIKATSKSSIFYDNGGSRAKRRVSPLHFGARYSSLENIIQNHHTKEELQSQGSMERPLCSTRRRHSLRSALFRKQNADKIQEAGESLDSLQITDILKTLSDVISITEDSFFDDKCLKP